jgi:hypothetical protein
MEAASWSGLFGRFRGGARHPSMCPLLSKNGRGCKPLGSMKGFCLSSDAPTTCTMGVARVCDEIAQHPGNRHWHPGKTVKMRGRNAFSRAKWLKNQGFSKPFGMRLSELRRRRTRAGCAVCTTCRSDYRSINMTHIHL